MNSASDSHPTISLLVLQPTPFCNIDCDYCYLPNRTEQSRMSRSTLGAVLANVFESPFIGTDLTIVWHAGEPLVLPIDFYDKAMRKAEELRPSTCTVRHSVQTNGTLISDAWCRLFREYDVRVGVSIDGPRHVHDAHRRTRSRKGTFDRTMAGIEKLKAAGQEFHVISVLTDANIRIPDEMFYFYDQHGIDTICFNVEETDGIHSSNLLRESDVPRMYRQFLEAFMFLVHANKRNWSVREFDTTRRAVFRPDGVPFRNSQVEPCGIVCVDITGNVSTFSPEFIGMTTERFGDFVIGNLTRQSLESCLANEKFQQLYAEISEGVEACRRTCEYFSVCGGGAPANKLGEHGRMDVASTRFCDCTVKAPTDLLLSLLDKQIAEREGPRTYI